MTSDVLLRDIGGASLAAFRLLDGGATGNSRRTQATSESARTNFRVSILTEQRHFRGEFLAFDRDHTDAHPLAIAPAVQADRVFDALADWWHEATDFLSSPDEKVGHPAYQRIIQMGRAMIPFILADLHERGGDWYPALREITGENPVPPEDSGYVPQMNEDWSIWASRHGYAR